MVLYNTFQAIMNETTICSRCIMDTTVKEIKFDEQGICNFCHIHDEMEEKYPLNEKGKRKLDQIINKIKKSVN